MVAQPSPAIQIVIENQGPQSSYLKWAAVNLQEVVEKDHRLEASVYGIEARQVRRDLELCKWDVVLLGAKFIKDAFHAARFKRNYIAENHPDAVGFLGSSEVLDSYPVPVKFLLRNQVTEKHLNVRRGWVLISCSGTVGNVSYVNKTLQNYAVSQHVIRIISREYPGYIYAYLKSRMGRLLVETNNYGAVVKHIEPEHLNHIPIPNPPSILKQQIHNLIDESFKLRDRSNELMDSAQALLKNALRLPGIKELRAQTKQFDDSAGVLSFSVPISDLRNRLDGSYHVPIVQVIERLLDETAKEIVKVGDSRISQSVILPSHFKRIYVNEVKGTVLIGGKHLYSLDPVDKKYLAAQQYSEELRNDMLLAENMIVVTAKGTPGKVAIVPNHWNGWFISSNLIKIVPASEEIAGFLYCFLSSPYGELLIRRQIYGAVVDIIEPTHVKSIVVPFLKDEQTQMEINSKILDANRKRTEAYELEQEALAILDEKVINAQ